MTTELPLDVHVVDPFRALFPRAGIANATTIGVAVVPQDAAGAQPVCLLTIGASGVRLQPADARAIAKALLTAADECERAQEGTAIEPSISEANIVAQAAALLRAASIRVRVRTAELAPTNSRSVDRRAPMPAED